MGEPYLRIGLMPYGEALAAQVQFARLDQDRIEAIEAARENARTGR